MTANGLPSDGHKPVAEKGSITESKDPPWIVLAALIGIVFLLLSFLAWKTTLSAPITEATLALASLSSGMLVGFLFGLPRFGPYRGNSGLEAEEAQATTAPRADSSASAYTPSNNLEQISDWLTKILIGVGLVEIGKFGEALAKVGETVKSAFSEAPAGIEIITQSIIVVSAIGGFLLAFLWTRVRYPKIQSHADSAVWTEIVRLGVRVKGTEKTVELVAKGELTAPASSLPRDPGAVRSLSPASTLPATWPDDVRKKVQGFLSLKVNWNADPTATLFESAPRRTAGRELSVTRVATLGNALVLEIAVTKLGKRQLTGDVYFLLHTTYPDRVLVAQAVGDRAAETVYSEAAYTVVAIADDGKTILSYDLSELPGAPKWFTEN